MDVVEPHDDRVRRPASSSSAAISRFSRSCEPPAVSAASRAAEESFADTGVILREPGWRNGPQQPAETAMLIVVLTGSRVLRARAGTPRSPPAAPNNVRARAAPFRRGPRDNARTLPRASSCRPPASAEITTSRALPCVRGRTPEERLDLEFAADDGARRTRCARQYADG